MVALYMTPKFKEKILKLTPNQISQTVISKHIVSSKIGDKSDLEEKPLEDLHNLFERLSNTREVAVNPSQFREALPSRYKNSNHEEDASEFFRDYLDLIEKPLQSAISKVKLTFHNCNMSNLIK